MYHYVDIFSNEVGFNSNFAGSMHFSLARVHASMSKLSQEEGRNALEIFSHALAILEHQFTTGIYWALDVCIFPFLSG
jgi:hypothetical protein